MKQQFITATKARSTFYELIEKIKNTEIPMHITVKGIPEVVLVSKDHYDGLIATIETYEDPELMEQLRHADEDIKAGRFTSWEEVKAEMNMGQSLVAEKSPTTYVPNSSSQRSKKESKKTR